MPVHRVKTIQDNGLRIVHHIEEAKAEDDMVEEDNAEEQYGHHHHGGTMMVEYPIHHHHHGLVYSVVETPAPAVVEDVVVEESVDAVTACGDYDSCWWYFSGYYVVLTLVMLILVLLWKLKARPVFISTAATATAAAAAPSPILHAPNCSAGASARIYNVGFRAAGPVSPHIDHHLALDAPPYVPSLKYT